MAVVRAIEAFTYTDHKGVPQIIRVGDLLDESDPCVAKRRTLFESVGAAAARLSGVEAATAEPGEKRSRTRSMLSYIYGKTLMSRSRSNSASASS
jgi:hypothetical protein